MKATTYFIDIPTVRKIRSVKDGDEELSSSNLPARAGGFSGVYYTKTTNKWYRFAGSQLLTNVDGDHLVVEYIDDNDSTVKTHTVGELKRMMKLKAFL